MKFFLFMLLFVFKISAVPSQPLLIPATGYIAARAYGNDFSDVFSFTANQASLANLKNTSAGLYSEKKFFLSELDNYLLAFGLVTARGNFGMKMNYAGFAGSNEMQLGLAHAEKLGKNINAGIQFNYTNIRLAGYGNASAIGVELGSLFQLTHSLHAAIHATNPVSGKFGKDRNEKLPAVYSMGIGYEPSGLVLISSEIIKEEDLPVNINAGICYKITPQVSISMGILSATSSLWMGVEFLWKSYRLGFSAGYRQSLGISPGLLLAFDFLRGIKQNRNRIRT